MRGGCEGHQRSGRRWSRSKFNQRWFGRTRWSRHAAPLGSRLWKFARRRSVASRGSRPQSKHGWSCGANVLTAAGDATNPAILRILLQNGGNPNAISEVGGYTALRRAYQHGRSWESAGHGTAAWENWETLLDAGANAEATFAG